MKVLVVGFPKTGTKTMYAALTTLGYKCYDFEHNFHYLMKDWMKIFTTGGTKEDFYRMYKDVDAAMDSPVHGFWEEILEAFPDVKLVFMRRKSEDEWLKSFERQMKKIGENYLMKTLILFSPTAFAMWRYSNHVGRVSFSAPGQYLCDAFQYISPSVARRRYREHNAAVLQGAPKDQLLEFDLTDGWEPLCKFLEKPIPEEPFPHKNRGGTALDDYLKESPIFGRMITESKIVAAGLFTMIGISAFFALRHLRS